jgi:GH35 family endo-1,4-beta-xylanase
MTRDDIIKLAKEAGASFETAESMFKFATLVAAAEHEACAKLCDEKVDAEYAQKPVECMCGICKLGKREWVGLTDEEIAREFYKFEAADAWYQFSRAIEAKLKDKNHG